MSIIDDIVRVLKYAKEHDNPIKKVLMPVECYEKLTPEQIRYAEGKYRVSIKPIVHKFKKPKNKLGRTTIKRRRPSFICYEDNYRSLSYNRRSRARKKRKR